MTRPGEYEKAEPAAAGLDPAKLQAALDYANLSNPLTMKVFRHGCLLGEGLRDPLFDRVPANNWGQTKTITASARSGSANRAWISRTTLSANCSTGSESPPAPTSGNGIGRAPPPPARAVTDDPCDRLNWFVW